MFKSFRHRFYTSIFIRIIGALQNDIFATIRISIATFLRLIFMDGKTAKMRNVFSFILAEFECVLVIFAHPPCPLLLMTKYNLSYCKKWIYIYIYIYRSGQLYFVGVTGLECQHSHVVFYIILCIALYSNLEHSAFFYSLVTYNSLLKPSTAFCESIHSDC